VERRRPEGGGPATGRPAYPCGEHLVDFDRQVVAAPAQPLLDGGGERARPRTQLDHHRLAVAIHPRGHLERLD
jgi:hypothetical protein